MRIKKDLRCKVFKKIICALVAVSSVLPFEITQAHAEDKCSRSGFSVYKTAEKVLWVVGGIAVAVLCGKLILNLKNRGNSEQTPLKKIVDVNAVDVNAVIKPTDAKPVLTKTVLKAKPKSKHDFNQIESMLKKKLQVQKSLKSLLNGKKLENLSVEEIKDVTPALFNVFESCANGVMDNAAPNSCSMIKESVKKVREALNKIEIELKNQKGEQPHYKIPPIYRTPSGGGYNCEEYINLQSDASSQRFSQFDSGEPPSCEVRENISVYYDLARCLIENIEKFSNSETHSA